MLRELDYYAVEYVSLNMRDNDWLEISALLPHDNPLQFAHEAVSAIRNDGRGIVAWHDAKPAVVGAFTQIRPGVWSVWMFGTDDFKAVAFELMRWVRTEAADILKHAKGHRLQCESRVGYDEAHKMIKAMGGIQEGPPLRRFGKDEADYIRFVWFNGENDAVIKPHYERPRQ